MLLCGLSPTEAWTNLLRCGPAPSGRPAEAWDRFPAPSSKSGETTSSSLRVIDCLAGLVAAWDKGWFESPREFDVAAWRMLRSKFDASWVIPGELLTLASGERKPREKMSAGIDTTRPGRPDSLGTSVGGSVGTRATSSGSASEEEEDLENDEVEEVPRLLRASPLLRDLPVFRSFCFDIPDERGPWDSEGSDVFRRSTAGEIRQDSSIVQFLTRSHVGLFIRMGGCPSSGPKCHADDGLVEASIRVTPCPAPGFADTPAIQQAVLKNFLDVCERHRASPGVAAGIALNGQFAPDGLGVLLAAYIVERHFMDGAAAYGWLRICRPGAVPTPEQERLVRMMSPVAPTSPGLAKTFARKFVYGKKTAAQI